MRANHIRNVALAASVAALVGAAPAFAADVVFQEPPAPSAPIISTPVSTWAGPYGGLSFGYGFGNTNITNGVNVPNGNISTGGWMAGAFLGWNGQSNNFVYGVEGDIGYNWMHDRNSDFGSQAGWEGSLRARLGYAVSDATLLYVTAGGAAQGHRFIDASGTDRETHLGWTVGAGVDQKLTDKMFGRLEYRYTDFSRKSYATPAVTADIKPNNHRISVGLGMQF